MQNVGYRWFVKGTADSLNVRGAVMNQKEGSVLIVADSTPEVLEKFEARINVSTEHGIQVLKIEKLSENDPSFPKIDYDVDKFTIKK